MSDREPPGSQPPPPPPPPSPPPPPQPGPAGTRGDWRQERREARWRERQQRRGAGGPFGAAPWLGGLVLIAIGVVFLLRNFDLLHLHNWWALFLLIPAAALFGAAWNGYRAAGELSAGVIGPLAGGLVLTGLAIAFLLGIEWGKFWPVILILVGVVALSRGWRR